MADLSGYGILLSGLNWLYWIVAVAASIWARRATKSWAAVGLVAAVFLAPTAIRVVEVARYRPQISEAQALFDERCKTAGEKVDSVARKSEGIVMLRWRPVIDDKGQFSSDDLYGKDCSAEGCILMLLSDFANGDSSSSVRYDKEGSYKFVETIDPRDGVVYRYSVIKKSVKDVPPEQFLEYIKRTGHGSDASGNFMDLHRNPVNTYTARFGITWEDISTREDREHWIAGGALRVIDLQSNNEIVAEHRGYLLDTGQGSTAGQRDPWGWAKSYGPRCPSTDVKTWKFAKQIIQPLN